MKMETLMRSDKPVGLNFWKIFTALFVFIALAVLGIIIYFIHGAFSSLFPGEPALPPGSPAAAGSPAPANQAQSPAAPNRPAEPGVTDEKAVQKDTQPPAGLQNESRLKLSMPGFYQDQDGVWRNVDTGGRQAEKPAFSASLPEAWPLKSFLPEGLPLQGLKPEGGLPVADILSVVLSGSLTTDDRSLLESLLSNTLKGVALSSGGGLNLQSLLGGAGPAQGSQGSPGQKSAAEIFRDSDGVWRNYPTRPGGALTADEPRPEGLLSLDPQGLNALFEKSANFSELSGAPQFGGAAPVYGDLPLKDLIRDFSGFEYFKPEEAGRFQSDWEYFEDPRGPLIVR